MELLRPSSLARARRRALRPRRHGGGAAAARRHPARGHARRRARHRPRGYPWQSHRCRNDARGARVERRRPGGVARGVPPGRVAAAAEHGLDRRQPPPVDALLVLAAQGTRADCTAATAATPRRASTASMRSSRTTSARPRIPPTWRRPCLRSTRGCTRIAASSAWPSCTGSRTRPIAAGRRSSRASSSSSSSSLRSRRACT